jgi:hypothetical protein
MKHPHPKALLRARHSAHWLGLLFGLLLMGLLALPAGAAETADPSDPPDRAGRLAELNGQVWIFATDSNEWIAATRNRPVTTGDRISTENDGRAEVRIGSTVLRVAPNTELEVLQLDDNHLSLQLHSGSMTARLRTREAASEFSLATEEGRFRAERSGNYRFDRTDDTSHATAISGQAVYEGDGTALTVQQGQRVEFWKERGVAQYSVASPKRDEFGDWVASRDSREERSVSTRYVSPEMTGVEDLDRYGRWEQTPEYGAIWTPTQVVVGWAPYRMGHWAWVRPWGWTWVDDAPWGFAPFHYGRWVWHRNNWCWTPGRYVARPVYAPALVAWVGGPNVSVSVSVGRGPTVGWFPLGPREVYVPGYRVSPRYVRQVNVTQVTHITNVTNIISSPGQYMANARYANRGLAHAVTVVPSAVVERRQPVAPAIARVDDRMLRDMVRERPRADAPVVAPPRWTAGARPADDPRVSRPGFVARPVATPGAQMGVPPRGGNGNGPGDRSDRGDRNDRGERGDRADGPGAIGSPTARPQEPPRVGRERDNPVVNVPQARPTPPVANAPPPQVNQPRWAVPRDNDDQRSRAPAAGRVERPDRGQPAPGQPPQGAARPVMPERPVAQPQPGERMRDHQMPGPPRTAVQAPQPQMQAPAPVVRQPPQVQQHRESPREAQREGQREGQQGEGRQRGREDRSERANERR